MDSSNILVISVAIVYFAIVIFIGILAGKLTKKAEDLYVAGRSLGFWVTTLAIIATVQSGWTWMGYPGAAYGAGYANYVQVQALSFLGLALGYICLAKPMRVASERVGALTLPDLVAARFQNDKAVRVMTAFVVFVASLTYLVAQWAAVGWCIGTIFHIPYISALFIGMAIVAFYMVLGGMRAAMWTNLFQMIIMLIVSVYVAYKAVVMAGGYSFINATMAAINPSFVQPFHSSGTFVASFVLSYAILCAVFTYAAPPSVNLKFIMIKNHTALKWSPFVAVIAYWVGSLVYLVGMAGRVMVQQGIIAAPKAPDQIIIHVVGSLFPPFATAILFGAILAAVMSTAETFMFMSASSLVRDFWKMTLERPLTEKQEVAAMRIVMALVGIVTVLLAIKPPTYISLLGAQSWSMFSAGLGPLLYIGLRWRRASKEAAFWSMLAGIAIAGGVPLLNATVLKATPLFQGWHVGAIGIAVSAILFVAITWFTPVRESAIFKGDKQLMSSDTVVTG